MCLHCILIRYLIKITPRMSHFSYLTFNVIYWIIVYAVFKVHVRLNFIQPFKNLNIFRFLNHWINQLYEQQYPAVKVSTLLLGCLLYFNFSSSSESYHISNPRFQPAFRIKSALLSALLSEVIFYKSGSHLLFHTVSSAVSSAAYVLTVVFGMETGVSRKRITTGHFLSLNNSTVKH